MMKRVAGKKASSFIIDPRHNNAIGYWDILTSLALVFTALVTPVEVSFLATPTGAARWTNGLFLVNRVVDCIFIADMILQFFVAFSVDAEDGLMWIFDRTAIAQHYLTSYWFILDSISVLSSGPDVFEVDGLGDLTALRVVRVIRLIKLVRVLRGSRLFKRWEIRFAIDYAMLELSKTFFLLLVVCHWFACIWGLQASFDPLGSWPGAQGFCREWNSLSESCPMDMVCTAAYEANPCDGPACGKGVACVAALDMYMESIYTSAGTMTSGGAFTPEFSNTIEKLMATVMILLSGVLWSQLIGVLCGIAANLSPATQAFRKELSELNSFMANHPGMLDARTRFRLREYLHQSVHMKNAAAQKRILSELSPALHSEVIWKITERWLTNVRFLRNVDKELLVALAFHVNAKVFPPQEICPHGVLYIIHKGVAIYCGRIITAGDSWGDDLLMKNDMMLSNGHGIAVSYLWVYTLQGKVIKECLAMFPRSKKLVNMTNMRWMMARMLVKAARELKRRQKRLEVITGEKVPTDELIAGQKEAEEVAQYGDEDDGVAVAH